MSEMRRLAQVLATKSMDTATCHRTLHWLGFEGFTLSFSPFLDYLIELEPALRRLEKLYPNLQAFIHPFLMGRAWKTKLDSYLGNRERKFLEKNKNATMLELSEYVYLRFDTRKPREPKQDPVNHSNYHKWSTRQGSLHLNIPMHEVQAAPHGQAFLLHAAAKVMFHTWRFNDKVFKLSENERWTWSIAVRRHRINLPPTGVLPEASCCIADYSEEVPHDDITQIVPNLKVENATLNELAEAMRQAIADKIKKSKGKSYSQSNAYFNFISLLNETQGSDLLEPQRIDAVAATQTSSSSSKSSTEEISKVKTTKAIRRQGNRMSIDLKEEELLPEAVHSLDENDWGEVYQLLKSPRYEDQLWERNIWKNLHGAETASMRTLLRIAMVTAETPNRTARIRIFNAMHTNFERDDFKNLYRSALVIHKDGETDDRTFWITRDAPKTGLQLEIPIKFEWNSNIVDAQLYEVFPIQLQKLLKSTAKTLGAALDRSEPSCRQTIKHTLARLLYVLTVDRAVIEYICGKSKPEKENAMKEGSLTHYVHKNSPIIKAAYANAVMAMLQPDGRPEAIDTNSWNDDKLFLHVNQRDLQNAVRLLRDQAMHTPSASVKVQHNAIAIYCGFLILVSLGIREQSNILPFLWDLDLKAMLAFICDKPLLGSEARFLPIPHLVVKQFEQFRMHLYRLLATLEKSDRSAALEVRIALGITKTVNTECDFVKSQLFTFEGKGIASLSTSIIEDEI